MVSIVAALEEALKKIAAEQLILFAERRLVCARAEGHFIVPRK